MHIDPLADFFEEPDAWSVVSSGLSVGKLSREEGPDGKPALRLDYDFHQGKGFVVARREIRFLLPDTFEFRFQISGEAGGNQFEFKITDAGGANAWRFADPDFKIPENWAERCVRERDLPFAWGPEGGGPPRVVGAIELAIVAGPGGSGSVWFSDMLLEDQTLYLPATYNASSYQANHPPWAVFEPGSPSGWRAEDDDPSPWWSVDFGRVTRFGGMVIVWPLPMPPRAFTIYLSEDGECWKKIHEATHAMGRSTHIAAPLAQARFVRIDFPGAEMAGLAEMQFKPDSFSHTPNDFMHAVAADFPRGWYPRYWVHEQSYWTPLGTPDGGRRALINEEGLVEVDEAAFSLEPFLVVGGNLVTWADAAIRISLEGGGLPFPVVTWTYGEIELKVRPWVDGAPGQQMLHVTYSVKNRSPHDVRLAVAARPFQVVPPWQRFRNIGGISRIKSVSSHCGGMIIEGRRVLSDRRADDCGAAMFEEDGVVAFLSRGGIPPRQTVEDPSGLAAGVLVWDMPGDAGRFEVTVSVPFFENIIPPAPKARAAAMLRWREILSTVQWDVPEIARSAVETFRTASAHILINRDGPAMQPGPRRYTRSWVRDCVIMGAALAKIHRPEPLHEFIRWYANFQREDGYIPAVVDRDGVDPIVEHDSHGQFLWGVCEVFRAEKDLRFLKTQWPRVRLAAEFLIALREETRSAGFCDDELSACHGLLPESASHEGYLAHPVHSYWDDFWGIRGLEAAAEIAADLGRQGDADRWFHEARQFMADTLRSIRKVIKDRDIEYIPGSLEWADFDPTATANAVNLLDFADHLPQEPLNRMLDTYLAGFRGKHHGELPWVNYTAYEIRIIGAFIRLGRRDDARELLRFFLSDRRPLAWNQWPEISWRDPRSPGHLGDVPHTWIAAEYMLALASLVASEREEKEEMVLAAGLSWKWISGKKKGFAVNGLMTRWGPLDFRISGNICETGVTIDFHIGDTISQPPGGLFLDPPLPPSHRIVTATGPDGGPLEILGNGRSIVIDRLPLSATLTLENTLPAKKKS